MARMVSFLVLVAILIGIGLLFMQVMWGFLLPLFLAALLGVVFQPLYTWTLEKCQGYRYVASGVTTLLVLLVVLAPAGLVLTMAVLQGLSLIDQLNVTTVPEKIRDLRKYYELEIPQASDLHRIEASLNRWREQQRDGDTPQYTSARVDNLVSRVDSLQSYLNEQRPPDGTGDALAGRPELIELRKSLLRLRDAKAETLDGDEALAIADASFRVFKRQFLGGTYMAWLKEAVNPSEEQWKQWRATIVGKSGSPLVALGGDTVAVVGKALFGAIIMVISLFFFLAEGGKMLNALVRLSPLEERYLRELIDEFERVSRAVVAATLLAAAAQGVLAGIGFWCVGLRDSVALLVILTALLAMVPFAGAAAVWIPVCLYLYFYDGRAVTAGLLAVYGAGVVSTADNFIKPLVLHGQSNLHPLLALLSVLGGVTALGPIGIMVGPMAVVFLQTLLKILQREMLNLDKLNRLPLATWATGWRQGTPTAPAPLVNDTDSPTENPPPASPPQGSQPGNNKQGKKKKK